MNFIKHVGRQGDRKCLILFRQVPGEDHMALVIYPEVMPAHWQDSIQKCVESDVAQAADELAGAMHRAYLPDGSPILETLHRERMIKKVRTSDVIVTPRPDAQIRLDELNKILNEMKQGESAIKKLAENDAARGMVAPDVKRRAEAEFKASQTQTAPAQTFQAPAQGALSDRDIAANMLAQAQKMESEAKGMIAEAARMKKEAAKMDPRVVAKEAPAPVAATTSKRGRPAKAKTAVADAAQ